MIPLAIPNLAGREAEYLQKCVDTNFVSTVGPFVAQFETMVAKASGALYAVATSAGTTGLHAALVAVGVSPGDLVVIPTFTFIATANAVMHCGALPWLFDVSPDSWTLDTELLAAELRFRTTHDPGGHLIHRDFGRRVSAIVPVYTFGSPADMDGIMAIAAEFRLPVVADAAAALGATYKGRNVGSLGADLTMFSFNGNKTFTAGGGGIIAGDDEALVQRVRHLTTTARVGTDYDHDVVGFNYRMTNLQAAVGCAQMEQFDLFLAKKRHIRDTYNNAFATIDCATPFPEPSWAKSACWFSGVVLNHHDPELLRASLRSHEIDARPAWKPMHLQAPYRHVPSTQTHVADIVWSKIITLPCSTSISESELSQVIDAVRTELGQ